MSTPNLAIAHIQASQDQKEVTANAAFDALDLAMTESGFWMSAPAASFPCRPRRRAVSCGSC